MTPHDQEFVTGIYTPDPTKSYEENRKIGLSKILSAYAKCCFGMKPPEKFGEGIIAINKHYNFTSEEMHPV